MKFFNTKKGLLLLGMIVGLGAAILAYFGNPKNMAFCIACFIRDIAGSMHLHQAGAVQYFRPEIVGLVIGSFGLSLATKEFRSTAGSSPILRFFLGMIMMVCALVFLGCPLRMLLRMSAGDISAYIGLIGFTLGITTGIFFLKKGFSLGRSYLTKKESGAAFPVLLGVAFALFVFVPSLFAISEKGPGSMHAPLILSLVIGLLVGMIAQQTRMCFAGSIRDIFLLRDFKLFSLISGIFIVMLIYNIIVGDFEFVAYGPVAHAQTLWNILSMYGVGFAAVLLGGCPLRQLIIAGTGSADAVITVFGMFFGAAIAHNFGLAAKPAALATVEKAASVGGPGLNGKIFVIISIVALLFIAYRGTKKQSEVR